MSGNEEKLSFCQAGPGEAINKVVGYICPPFPVRHPNLSSHPVFASQPCHYITMFSLIQSGKAMVIYIHTACTMSIPSNIIPDERERREPNYRRIARKNRIYRGVETFQILKIERGLFPALGEAGNVVQISHYISQRRKNLPNSTHSFSLSLISIRPSLIS